MNKAQLVEVIADRLGSKRAASEAVEVVLDTITRSVAKGDRVAITGFGSFEKHDRPARYARNPRTGERVRVKKTAVPRFRAGQGFRDVVSGAKKLPKIAGGTTSRVSAAGTATTTRASGRPAGARAGATGGAARPKTAKPAAGRAGTKPAAKAPARAAAGARAGRGATPKATAKPTAAAKRQAAKKPARGGSRKG